MRPSHNATLTLAALASPTRPSWHFRRCPSGTSMFTQGGDRHEAWDCPEGPGEYRRKGTCAANARCHIPSQAGGPLGDRHSRNMQPVGGPKAVELPSSLSSSGRWIKAGSVDHSAGALTSLAVRAGGKEDTRVPQGRRKQRWEESQTEKGVAEESTAGASPASGFDERLPRVTV